MKDLYRDQPNGRQLHAVGKYASGRAALLLVVAMSFFNLATIVAAGRYFVFSSYLTRFLSELGAGRYQATQQLRWLFLFGALAAVSVIPYLLCYLFSKKQRGWIIAALVLFSLDTLFLVLNVKSVLIDSGSFVGILDYLVHGWVIYSLAVALKHSKLALTEETVLDASSSDDKREN